MAEQDVRISHKYLYQYIYVDKRTGGDLHHHLLLRIYLSIFIILRILASSAFSS